MRYPTMRRPSVVPRPNRHAKQMNALARAMKRMLQTKKSVATLQVLTAAP